MGLLFRGIVWFGAYLGLALLPLAAALIFDPLAEQRPFTVELGVACGFIAFALLAVEFALVSRLRAAAEPFGIDALMQFHRQMGLVALGFLIAHALLSSGRSDRTGAIALCSVVVLIVVSVGRKRLGLRYELWESSHRALAVIILGAALVHTRAMGRYWSARPVAIVLGGYVVLFLALALRHWLVRPFLLQRRPWEVVENRVETGSACTLRLRPVGHAGITFAPGQFAWVITGRTPLAGQQHPMTISSSAEPRPDHSLEFSIKALGDWSRDVVPTLQLGSRLWIDGPYGAFTPDREPGQGLVLIAGGAGITPMRSILLTMRDREDRRPVLAIVGARSPERVIFGDEITALAGEIDLEIVYVFEEPPPNWTGEHGFINADVLRRHLPRHSERYQYFVCGPAPMMDAVEAALTEVGVPPECVHTERFNMV